MNYKHVRIVLFLLFVFLVCVGCENKVESAKKLWQENKQDEAMSILKSELTANPSNTDAKLLIDEYQLQIVKKLWQENKQDEAMLILKSELNTNPENTTAKLLLDEYQSKIDQQALEKVALQYIKQHLNYPYVHKKTFYNIRLKSPLGQEVARLVREGYVIENKSGHLKPTEKGKNFLIKGYYNSWHGDMFIEIPVSILDVSKITKILIDSKNNEALVQFELTSKRTEYYSKIISIDKEYFGEDENLRENTSAHIDEIRFKKWGNEWRIKEM